MAKEKKNPGGRRTLYKAEMCDLVERRSMFDEYRNIAKDAIARSNHRGNKNT